MASNLTSLALILHLPMLSEDLWFPKYHLWPLKKYLFMEIRPLFKWVKVEGNFVKLTYFLLLQFHGKFAFFLDSKDLKENFSMGKTHFSKMWNTSRILENPPILIKQMNLLGTKTMTHFRPHLTFFITFGLFCRMRYLPID